jgi:hypothetical protein
VRAKQRASVLVEQRAARDRTEAYHDARALAIELARGEPTARFDPMTVGVVLQPGETVYRQVPIWIRVQNEGRWADASFAAVLVSDMRLLCRFATGRLSSLWWSGVVGLNVDLAAEHIVLDYGDGQPVGLSGEQDRTGFRRRRRLYIWRQSVGHPFCVGPVADNGIRPRMKGDLSSNHGCPTG